jgi:hypothetical protein
VNTDVQSNKSHKNNFRESYGFRCLFCKTTENVTVAHIASHNSTIDFSNFGPPVYSTELDHGSVRNRILLTIRDSCHNLFDYNNLIFFYNHIESKYKLFTIDSREVKDITFPVSLSPNEYPYKRLLARRARAAAFEHAHKLTHDDLNSFPAQAELKENEEIATFVEDCDDSNTTTNKTA